MKSQVPESFYRLLFDNANDGILLADLKTQKFYIANKAICKMLGYTLEEIKNLAVKDIHPEKDLSGVMEQFDRQSRGKIGENILAEGLPVKRKNGSVFYADITASRVKIAGKVYLMGIFRDITYRKQIEKNLENSRVAARNVLEDLRLDKETLARAKARDDAILASIGDGLVATGENGGVLLINHTFENLLGWKEPEIQGKLLSQIVPMTNEKGELIPDSERLVNKVLKEKNFTVQNATAYCQHRNGMLIPVSITVSPIMVDQDLVGVVEVFRDITKEKEIEKMRMDFLSLASHQLRTPLSGTKWLIETLQMGIIGELTQKQKEYLAQIHEINENMIKLVFDMLNALRLESGTVPIKKEAISALKLYNDLIFALNPAAKEKGWIILKNLLENKKDIVVETDIQILKTVLECFLHNAVQYSRQGEEIILDAKEEAAAIMFSVKDKGIGIPKSEQKRIFERFFRASNAVTLKPGGTGLGLYIAAMLAEKIDAKVSFKSEENKGSVFYLRVPKGRAKIIEAGNKSEDTEL